VRNLDAAENELAPRDQRVNVVADANVNHGRTIKIRARKAKKNKNWPWPCPEKAGGGTTRGSIVSMLGNDPLLMNGPCRKAKAELRMRNEIGALRIDQTNAGA
jgi:hypothetical protein